MPEFVDIPEMTIPSTGSTLAFVGVIAFIVIAFVVGVGCGGGSNASGTSKKRWAWAAAIGIVFWLLIGAVVPMTGVLATKMLPPPPMFLVGASFLLAFGMALSSVGKRLSTLSFAALIGFHAFRLPLELVLHDWYESGTLPVQMTFEGHNFDIATGILAIVFGIWLLFGKIPLAALWGFNIVGTVLLGVVMFVALTSSPFPFRQYMNDPPVLLVYHFPYSWIVTIAVAGALVGHLVLFRKLLADSKSQEFQDVSE